MHADRGPELEGGEPGVERIRVGDLDHRVRASLAVAVRQELREPWAIQDPPAVRHVHDAVVAVSGDVGDLGARSERIGLLEVEPEPVAVGGAGARRREPGAQRDSRDDRGSAAAQPGGGREATSHVVNS